jgi:hypothetical protein
MARQVREVVPLHCVSDCVLVLIRMHSPKCVSPIKALAIGLLHRVYRHRLPNLHLDLLGWLGFSRAVLRSSWAVSGSWSVHPASSARCLANHLRCRATSCRGTSTPCGLFVPVASGGSLISALVRPGAGLSPCRIGEIGAGPLQ